jgi:hypothetical protein
MHLVGAVPNGFYDVDHLRGAFEYKVCFWRKDALVDARKQEDAAGLFLTALGTVESQLEIVEKLLREQAPALFAEERDRDRAGGFSVLTFEGVESALGLVLHCARKLATTKRLRLLGFVDRCSQGWCTALPVPMAPLPLGPEEDRETCAWREVQWQHNRLAETLKHINLSEEVICHIERQGVVSIGTAAEQEEGSRLPEGTACIGENFSPFVCARDILVMGDRREEADVENSLEAVPHAPAVEVPREPDLLLQAPGCLLDVEDDEEEEGAVFPALCAPQALPAGAASPLGEGPLPVVDAVEQGVAGDGEDHGTGAAAVVALPAPRVLGGYPLAGAGDDWYGVDCGTGPDDVSMSSGSDADDGHTIERRREAALELIIGTRHPDADMETVRLLQESIDHKNNHAWHSVSADLRRVAPRLAVEHGVAGELRVSVEEMGYYKDGASPLPYGRWQLRGRPVLNAKILAENRELAAKALTAACPKGVFSGARDIEDLGASPGLGCDACGACARIFGQDLDETLDQQGTQLPKDDFERTQKLRRAVPRKLRGLVESVVVDKGVQVAAVRSGAESCEGPDAIRRSTMTALMAGLHIARAQITELTALVKVYTGRQPEGDLEAMD